VGDVILHVPERYGDVTRPGRKRLLYTAIAEMVIRRGGRVRLARPAPKRDDQGNPLRDGHLHILDNGRTEGEGYLNAATAYLEDFWNLDPVGVLAESSIAGEPFDPAAVDPAAAAAFLAALRDRFVTPRRSRYAQAEARADLPQGAVAVFLQGAKPYRRGHAHVDPLPMLRAAVAGAQGRPVLVKPHPLDLEAGEGLLAAARAEGLAAVRTDANVHDVLAAAAVTLSVNSAASVEGFLHGVPAVLCGRSDFGAAAETVRQAEAIPAAIARALAVPRDHAPFLWWYFGQRCIWLDAPDIEARLLAAFARVGFPPDRLGLRV
jgi:hypothetical protein